MVNNKGQINSYFAVITFLFGFGVVTLLSMVLMLGLETAFTDAGLWTGVIETTGDSFVNALKLFDYITVIMLAVLIIGIGLTSFKLRTHPAFFIVTLVVAAFFGFTSYIFNYIFIQFVAQPEISAVEIFFPNTIAICTNLHWVALAVVIVGSITLYAKKPAEDGGFVG